MLKIVKSTSNSATFLQLQGRLVYGPDLDQFWHATRETCGQSIVLDLSGLERIDAAGLGALLAKHKESLNKGQVVSIACAPEYVIDLCRISGLDRVLKFDLPVASCVVA